MNRIIGLKTGLNDWKTQCFQFFMSAIQAEAYEDRNDLGRSLSRTSCQSTLYQPKANGVTEFRLNII